MTSFLQLNYHLNVGILIAKVTLDFKKAAHPISESDSSVSARKVEPSVLTHVLHKIKK